jgi:serine/threonine protein kinase
MMTTPEDQAACPTCGQAYPSRVAHCVNDGTQLILRRGRGADASGRVLDGRYEVRAPIAEGVLGVVYLGWQRTLDREVAIKILRPAFAEDQAGIARFADVARLNCQLAAPAITATYDCSNDNGLIYIVMELVRGRSLAQAVSERPLLASRAVPLAIQICDALDAAAKQRLFHGDLKPTNVLLVEQSRRDAVKLSDFGLVRALVPNAADGVEPSGLYYTAPELASGGTVNARTDLYALGCVIYEMLAGRPPFIDRSIRALLEMHRKELPPKLPRDVPARLASIVSSLLAKKPQDRPVSVAEVRQALHAVQGTSSSVAITFPGDANAAPGPGSGPHTRPPITGSHARPSTGGHSISGVPNAIGHSISGPHATTPPSGSHSRSGPHPTTPPSGSHPRSGPHPTTTPSGQHPSTSPHSAIYPSSAIDPNRAHAPATAPAPRAASSSRLFAVIISALVVSGVGIAAYLIATR